MKPMMSVIVFLVLLMMGCGSMEPRMSNDQIIDATRKCQDAGLTPEIGRNLSGEIVAIQCAPRLRD